MIYFFISFFIVVSGCVILWSWIRHGDKNDRKSENFIEDIVKYTKEDIQLSINKRKDSVQKAKSDYIENIHDINGEPIIFRIQQKLDTAKETLEILPMAMAWIIISVVVFAMGVFVTRFKPGIGFPAFVGAVVAFFIVFVLPPIMKRILLTKNAKHKSWAFSENYFVEVFDGNMEFIVEKDNIEYLEFNGYEIILTLDDPFRYYIEGANYLHKFYQDIGLVKDENLVNKLVLEDVINLEESYKKMKEWYEKDKESV